MAGVLHAHTRPQDLSARFGGEEFCLLVTAPDEDACTRHFEQLRAAVAALELSLGGSTLRMTVSIGVCRMPARNCTLHALIAEADRQLYLAKAGGRNRVHGVTLN